LGPQAMIQGLDAKTFMRTKSFGILAWPKVINLGLGSFFLQSQKCQFQKEYV